MVTLPPDVSLPPGVEAWLDTHPEKHPVAQALVDAGLGGTFTKFLADADDATLQAFFDDVAGRDLGWIGAHRTALLKGARANAPAAADLAAVEPGVIDDDARPALEAAGRKSLAAGEWGALVFAGGAATRFYTEAQDDPRVVALLKAHGAVPPKGLFPLTPVAGLCFLEWFAAEALAAGIAAGRMPFVIPMTSSLTDAAIRRWVATTDLQGFPKAMMPVLGQTEQPRLDDDGDLLVGDSGRLVVTGDGHGGVYKALRTRGRDTPSLEEQLRAAGVRGLVLHNVDNAAARPFEPTRLGWHGRGGYAFTMTMVPRARPDEKVGLAARNVRTGRIEVVEYSVCPPEVAGAVAADGTPVFRLAHINTNLVALDAINPDVPPTLYTGKRVTLRGGVVDSSSFEMLNQHLSGLLPAERVGVLLVDRGTFFLPTKSLHGDDSLEETSTAMSRAAAARLRALGADVDATAQVELDPCLPDDGVLSAWGVGRGWRLGAGSKLCLAVRHGPNGAPALGPGLTLGEGARLHLRVARPYGQVVLDATTRAVSEDRGTAGRLRLGDGVSLADGADLDGHVDGDGHLEIRAGAALAGRVLAHVTPGSCEVVG